MSVSTALTSRVRVEYPQELSDGVAVCGGTVATARWRTLPPWRVVWDKQADFDARNTAWNNASADRKLGYIKAIRLQKLEATDYLALSDVTMSDAVKTWRQTLRDLPQNNTTEEKYDELLARDSDGKLTHSVWTQPKE